MFSMARFLLLLNQFGSLYSNSVTGYKAGETPWCWTLIFYYWTNYYSVIFLIQSLNSLFSPKMTFHGLVSLGAVQASEW